MVYAYTCAWFIRQLARISFFGNKIMPIISIEFLAFNWLYIRFVYLSHQNYQKRKLYTIMIFELLINFLFLESRSADAMKFSFLRSMIGLHKQSILFFWKSHCKISSVVIYKTIRFFIYLEFLMDCIIFYFLFWNFLRIF